MSAASEANAMPDGPERPLDVPTDGASVAVPAPADGAELAVPAPAAVEAPPALTPRLRAGVTRRWATSATVAGLAVTGLGMFALPMQSYGVAGDVGFIQFRHLAGVPNAERIIGNAFATFWWRFGLLIALAVLVVLICAMVGESVPGGFGWTTTGWATLLCFGQVIALSQTTDYRTGLALLRPNSSVLAHPSIGVWVGIIGLAIVAGGGVIAGVAGRRIAVVVS